MNVSRKSAAAWFATVWFGAHALAVAAPAQTQARAEVKLAYGVNDVKLQQMTLRIIRGRVENGTASSFDTFTVYLMPKTPGDPWLQVTTSTPKGLGYQFRHYESADANTQAAAFYVEGRRLYAVQATKVGPTVDSHGTLKTPVDFEIVLFNENEEIPLFKNDSKRRSAGQYLDARDAIDHEIFGH
jgi:hypothetical protein